MNDERRDADRSPTFRNVELITTGATGDEVVYPIILRDSGESGLGGVYVGQDPFAPEGTATLRDSEGRERDVRIVWTKEVADFLHMVGLEIDDSVS